MPNSVVRKPIIALAILAFLSIVSPKANALALTIVNKTNKLVVCTIRSEETPRPLAQFFVYPGKQQEWNPFSVQAQHWQVSLVAEDNGMYTASQPVVVYPSSIANTLLVEEGHDHAKLEVLDSVPQTAGISSKNQAGS